MLVIDLVKDYLRRDYSVPQSKAWEHAVCFVGGWGGGLGRLRFLSLDNTQNVFFYEASPYDTRIGNFMTFLS